MPALQYVLVEYAEIQALYDQARNSNRSSAFGDTETQAFIPEIRVDPQLKDCPTIAEVAGPTNTVIVSISDMELLQSMLPYIGPNYNWWIQGVDSGVSARPDASTILRPQMLLNVPVLSQPVPETPGLVEVVSGMVTVLDTDSVETVDLTGQQVTITDTTVMVVSDTLGNLTALDTTDVLTDHVPVFYVEKPVGAPLVLTTHIRMAINATEAAYYLNRLWQYDPTSIETILAEVTQLKQDVIDLIAQYNTTLTSIPRVLSFYSFDEVGYSNGQVICEFLAPYALTLQNEFAGSKAKYTLLTGVPTLPAPASIDIYNGVTLLGTISFTAASEFGTFDQVNASDTFNEGDVITFKSNTLGGIGAIAINLGHLYIVV